MHFRDGRAAGTRRHIRCWTTGRRSPLKVLITLTKRPGSKSRKQLSSTWPRELQTTKAPGMWIEAGSPEWGMGATPERDEGQEPTARRQGRLALPEPSPAGCEADRSVTASAE